MSNKIVAGIVVNNEQKLAFSSLFSRGSVIYKVASVDFDLTSTFLQ